MKEKLSAKIVMRRKGHVEKSESRRKGRTRKKGILPEGRKRDGIYGSRQVAVWGQAKKVTEKK
jgi:hypothetical protein